MTETRDPPRLLDEASSLPRELLREMTAYSAMGPSLEQRERMFAGLEVALATSSAVPPPSASGQHFWSLWKVKVAGAAVAVVAAVWGMQNLPRASEEPPREAPRVVARVVSELSAKEAPRENAEAPPTPPSVAPEEVLPKPETKRVLKRAAKAAESKVEVALPNADPLAELSLLTRARRVLPTSPSRALEITAEHARVYPEGALSEEREVLAIDALVRADQRRQAEARARTFERAHPRSAHLARIRVILSNP